MLIGSDRDAAAKLLAGIKVELEMNDELLALYPEAVYPIRMLEGKANKATGQLCNGQRTYIEWKGHALSSRRYRTASAVVRLSKRMASSAVSAVPSSRGRMVNSHAPISSCSTIHRPTARLHRDRRSAVD